MTLTEQLPVISQEMQPNVSTQELHRALAEAISTHDVRYDRVSRALYATDASVYQIVPLMIAFPATPDDVVEIVRVCGQFGVPITARGGGTSQAGQCIGSGVILDFSKHFARVLEINLHEHWVRVEPGCVLDDLNLALQPHGLQFAPDISTSNRATIGGMIANNSSGARSVWYGKTIDHVQELQIVLSDGTLITTKPVTEPELEVKRSRLDLEGACYRTVRRLAQQHNDEIDRRFPKILRRVGGYNLDSFVPRHVFNPHQAVCNLAHLFIGSEGTLGLTVEAKLKLVERPRARATLVIEFANLLEALAATPLILKHNPAAVEVIDQYVLDSTRLNAEASRLRDFLHGDPGAILLIELYDDCLDNLAFRLASLEGECRRGGYGYHWHGITDPSMQARAWKLRTIALGLSMAEKGDAKAISFVEDTAVAPENLHDYIAEFHGILARHQTTAGTYAHASVGCLHVRPVINLKTEQGVRTFAAIAEEVADLVLKYGGALSGEHGDGLVRSPFQEKMYGSVLYQAFCELKNTFDPQGLLNPGKIVDAPPLTNNLRYGPRYQTPNVLTTFDFTADGGLLPAAELCAGVGECRKQRGGTMCPSYQATREERDSTRGRANVLRLAISGQLGFQGLTDPAVHDVFDLCLECKACKSECPTNVDMARLKSEFLHQYHHKHGVPWRNRVFGHVAILGRIGSALAPTSSWLVQNGLSRWLNSKLLGIDSRRVPPRFARRSLAKLYASLPWNDNLDVSRCALLFPDTFTNYFQPEVGTATIELLQRAGYAITLGPQDLVCCGRPLISNGLLDQAVANARHNVERLHQWTSRGGSIIACEPSCILTIKDDYPALLKEEFRARAEQVSRACLTLEEYIEFIIAQNGHKTFSFNPVPRKIIVQCHCHQRSLVGTGPLMKILRSLPKAEVIDLDAGCCGMAGSFGYEAEHYEISQLVGEQRLLPAIRRTESDTVIVAPGFSCRLQIQHFTGRDTVHPAQLLRESLT